MLYCVSLLEKSISRGKKKCGGGTLRKMCIWLHGQAVFTCSALFCFFFHLVRGGCLTLNSDSARNPWALQSVFCRGCFLLYKSFSHESERARVSLSVWAFIGVTESHKHPHSMDQNGLKFRAMQGPYTESSFEMYIQCEGLKWFFFGVKFYILSLL